MVALDLMVVIQNSCQPYKKGTWFHNKVKINKCIFKDKDNIDGGTNIDDTNSK